jgi:hypothetical protein
VDCLFKSRTEWDCWGEAVFFFLVIDLQHKNFVCLRVLFQCAGASLDHVLFSCFQCAKLAQITISEDRIRKGNRRSNFINLRTCFCDRFQQLVMKWLPFV